MRRGRGPTYICDIKGGQRLYASCPQCSRTVELDPRQLERRFRPMFTYQEIRARVRCLKCGQRTLSIHIVEGRVMQ